MNAFHDPRARPGKRLERRFYLRPVQTVARDLLGRLLLCRRGETVSGGIIVETEAYDEHDPASHCFAGVTERNRVMFAEGGALYVYRSYGMHWCCNVVVGRENYGAAVLLRAIEPTVGVELMQRRRRGLPLRDLARGPGRLCAALGITLDDYGADLGGQSVWLETPATFRRPKVLATPRIGITKGVETPWRFCIPEHPFVSGPRRLRTSVALGPS